MKRTGLVVFIFAAACGLLITVDVDAQSTGAIVGTVVDDRGNPLVGAEITIANAGGLATKTDEQGRYRLTGVPTGSQTVIATYLSTSADTRAVTIESGKTMDLEFRLKRFGEEIEVRAPMLEGQASALNQQKAASNITNVVSADQIGSFPDPNAAEATQRVPAVTLQRDQGEGRYILVRGTEARLNSTTVDGERIPSPEAGGRDIALDVIPADLLQAIEVSKALLPDMDGDAIGGSVNLVTKRAPETTRISATAAGGYNDLTEGGIKNGNFTWGSRLGPQKNFGMLVGGSYYDTNRGSDNFEVEYDDGDLETLDLRDYVINRKRVGATVALDYRLSDQMSLFGRYLWNDYQDTEIRRAMVNKVGDDEITREIKDRLQESKIISLTGGGERQIGTTSTLDFRAAWNRAEEETPGEFSSVFVQEDVDFDPNVSSDSIDPDNIRANPRNQNLNDFLLDEISLNHKFAEEKDFVGVVNFAHSFYRSAAFNGTWKTGGKVRFKDKNQDDSLLVFGPDDDFSMSDILSNFRSETTFLGGRYDNGLFADPKAVKRLFDELDGDKELDPEEDLADFDSSEDTQALYLMSDVAFGAKTSIVAGVRVERTQTDYVANELDFDEDGDFAGLTKVTGGNEYTLLLPMVHWKYRLDDRTNLRAAVTRTFARPNFIDLAPFQLIVREDEEIERGNPQLSATKSWNVDFFAERYFQPIGVLSGGIFYKRLTDNIFTFRFEEDFDGDEFDVSQKRNGGDGKVLGAEMAFERAIARGVGVYFNFTVVDSEAQYPDRGKERLQGQAETTGNFAISLERGRFSGRVSVNHNSGYLFEIGEEPEEDLFIDKHLQFDLGASFRLTNSLSLNLQLLNLTDEPYRVYQGSPNRPIQEEYYGSWGTLGLKLNL
jgi:TonB-dependent receptor